MIADTRATILDAARLTAQAHGYAGLSFRELGKQVGIKSASIHYHFPTKGDLAAALARDYARTAEANLAAISAATPDAAGRLTRYAALFRKALENGNRMCLCGIFAAEYDELPDIVRAEVVAFADLNIAWLAAVFAEAGSADPQARAEAVYAAIGGAQLAARSRGDITQFDRIVAAYRASGLLPA